jgi:hypothetical protein
LLALLLALPAAAAERPDLALAVSHLNEAGTMPVLARVGGQVRAVEAGTPGLKLLRMTAADARRAFDCYAESLREEPLSCPEGGAEIAGEDGESLSRVAVIGMAADGKGGTAQERLESRLPRFLIAASAKTCPRTQRAWAQALAAKGAAPSAQGAQAKPGAGAESALALKMICDGVARIKKYRSAAH